MKLNKAYYVSKVDELICAIDWRCDEPNEKKFEVIVMSIAMDALSDAVAAVRKESHLLVLDAWIEERLAAAITALELEGK